LNLTFIGEIFFLLTSGVCQQEFTVVWFPFIAFITHQQGNPPPRLNKATIFMQI